MDRSRKILSSASDRKSLETFGDCKDCGLEHQLSVGNAPALAREMMHEFETIRRLDYWVPESEADPRLSFENLFPAGHGNMFGVLECENDRGESVVLRAFSSLPEGIRQIDGWVLPLLSLRTYEETILPAQNEIKKRTTEMEGLASDSLAYMELKEARRRVSQRLWEKMCTAYRLRNFRGEERSLREAIWPGTPITGGIGECCAPKLLNHAALHRLRPMGLAEFFWGADQKPGGRVSGQFYPSCKARCQPILGFMLCGIET
jgi:hypothetical protein